MRNNYSIIFIVCLFLFFISCGCEKTDFLPDDLTNAKAAYTERNMPLAERLLERYLRDEQDPEKRWQAWNLLLNAINANNQEARASLEFLDSMLDEYENDEAKLKEILAQMGKYNESLRHHDSVEKAWSAYVELGELNDDERVNGFRRLAAAQFAQRHFDAGEETLQQCLALPITEHDKITCMLDLAELNLSREQWQDVASLCQQIQDSDPDKTIFGIAGYLRGDALEQMGKDSEALKQFEIAKDSYPNPAVMDNRIEYLLKKKKKMQ